MIVPLGFAFALRAIVTQGRLITPWGCEDLFLGTDHRLYIYATTSKTFDKTYIPVISIGTIALSRWSRHPKLHHQSVVVVRHQ